MLATYLALICCVLAHNCFVTITDAAEPMYVAIGMDHCLAANGLQRIKRTMQWNGDGDTKSNCDISYNCERNEGRSGTLNQRISRQPDYGNINLPYENYNNLQQPMQQQSNQAPTIGAPRERYNQRAVLSDDDNVFGFTADEFNYLHSLTGDPGHHQQPPPAMARDRNGIYQQAQTYRAFGNEHSDDKPVMQSFYGPQTPEHPIQMLEARRQFEYAHVAPSLPLHDFHQHQMQMQSLQPVALPPSSSCNTCQSRDYKFQPVFIVPCSQPGAGQTSLSSADASRLQQHETLSAVTQPTYVAAAATDAPQVGAMNPMAAPAFLPNLRLFPFGFPPPIRVGGLDMGLNLLRTAPAPLLGSSHVNQPIHYPIAAANFVNSNLNGFLQTMLPRPPSTTYWQNVQTTGFYTNQPTSSPIARNNPIVTTPTTAKNLNANESPSTDTNTESILGSTKNLKSEIKSPTNGNGEPGNTADDDDDVNIFNEQIPNKLENESRKTYKSLIIAAKSFMNEATADNAETTSDTTGATDANTS